MHLFKLYQYDYLQFSKPYSAITSTPLWPHRYCSTSNLHFLKLFLNYSLTWITLLSLNYLLIFSILITFAPPQKAIEELGGLWLFKLSSKILNVCCDLYFFIRFLLYRHYLVHDLIHHDKLLLYVCYSKVHLSLIIKLLSSVRSCCNSCISICIDFCNSC